MCACVYEHVYVCVTDEDDFAFVCFSMNMCMCV